MAIVTVAIVRQRSLFGVVNQSSNYSFLIASVMIVLDAVDVAMTEASVGAGISTVVLLATLHLTKTTEAATFHRSMIPLLLSVVTGSALVWGALALAPFGGADTPIHTHVAPRYLSETINETGVPNAVTSVLADYRGFDTLGETTVIFTAGIGVMLLLGGRRKKEKAKKAGGRS
jgi:multicomponent Na+:H+ antiporter subunit B